MCVVAGLVHCKLCPHEFKDVAVGIVGSCVVYVAQRWWNRDGRWFVGRKLSAKDAAEVRNDSGLMLRMGGGRWHDRLAQRCRHDLKQLHRSWPVRTQLIHTEHPRVTLGVKPRHTLAQSVHAAFVRLTLATWHVYQVVLKLKRGWSSWQPVRST